jgi:hypothetical protein
MNDVLDLLPVAKLNFTARLQRKIIRFWIVLCTFGFKDVKSISMTPNNNFLQNFICAYKAQRKTYEKSVERKTLSFPTLITKCRNIWALLF